MFDKVKREIEASGDTVQLEIESDKLVPAVELIDDKRVFSLTHRVDNTKYLCLEKGWTSWAEKILVPAGEEDRNDFGLMDEETGRKKRWSVNTVRKFLDMSPISLADKMVKSWWERSRPVPWHVVKYADNGVNGAIRYVGTSKYRLYKHKDFISDLSGLIQADQRLVLRKSYMTEDMLCLRVTDNIPLEIKNLRGNIYPGYNILNSENGSSSILIKYLIYDLLCTNGLMIVYDSSTLINQKHINFNIEEFRVRVSKASEGMEKLNETSRRLVENMASKRLSPREIQAVMKLYRQKYECSGSFVEKVLEKVSSSDELAGWSVISAITEVAQQYNLQSRMGHEENASRLILDLMKNNHNEFMENTVNG